MLNLVAAELLGRLRRRLNDVFFAPSDAQSLNLFRFLYCASLIASVLTEGMYQGARLRLLQAATPFAPIRLFDLLGIHGVSADALSLFRVILLAALFFAAFGILTRWSLAAAWISFFLYYGTIHSSTKPLSSDRIGHVTDSVIFILWILSVSPGVGTWGIDGWIRRRRWRLGKGASAVIPAWPVRTIVLMLATFYFGAAYCKWKNSLLWADGYTLQAYLLQSVLENEPGLNLRLADHLWLCASLSVVTLVFESSFGAILFFPRLAWLYVPTGLGMHAVIAATMNRNYFRYFGCSYLVFLSWPLLLGLCSPLKAAREESMALRSSMARGFRDPPSRRRRRMAGAFILALGGTSLACIIFGVDAWPFSSWRFFSARMDYTKVRAFRIQERTLLGETRWPRQTQGAWNVGLSDMYRQAMRAQDYQWVRDNLWTVMHQLPKDSLEGLESLVMIKREVRKSPAGGFEFVDIPIAETRVGVRPLEH